MEFISYKNCPPVAHDMVCSFDKMNVTQRRKVLDKDMEVPLFLIGFLLVGGKITWAFDDEKERDWVWENVLKEFRDEIQKIDNYK